MDGPDPVNVAVFLEDAIAVGGVGVAAAGIGLTALTGNGCYDAVCALGSCRRKGVSFPSAHATTPCWVRLRTGFLLSPFARLFALAPFCQFFFCLCFFSSFYICLAFSLSRGSLTFCSLVVSLPPLFGCLRAKVGSIGVGLLMGGVSAFIVSKNRRLLGQAVPDSKLRVTLAITSCLCCFHDRLRSLLREFFEACTRVLLCF